MERIVEAIRERHTPLVAGRGTDGEKLMLYYLFVEVLRPYFHALNVFRYITVRTAYASLTALVLTLVLGPWVIRKLQEMQIGQFIREEGPKSHQKKAGTPTMGGVLIVIATIVPTLLWADLTSSYVLLTMGAMVAFGAIGFTDDYLKVSGRHNKGLSARGKLGLQILVSLAAGVALIALTGKGAYSTQLVVPFFKKFHPDLVSHTLAGSSLHLAAGVYSAACVRRSCDCGFIERGESYRWARWPGDWLHGNCRGSFHGADVFDQQRAILYLSRNSIHSSCGGVDGVLRSACRRVHGISLVQRASGGCFHGRCRVAVARRHDRRARCDFEAGSAAVFCRRSIRDRGGVCHFTSCLFPAYRQANFSHGAAASPF